ncbi:MAG: ABC transporter ATP-binding protein [Oscillospiraceae bacterium]|jgi:teichoic acid transport system ATP-binding protein|nr:ABC transporter ATP-binding protein [Oscillospiraceae bacterium]
MNQSPIISFANVSKEYVLYKNDQERFKALFVGNKKFKKHQALKDISINIFPGESVGIIGDNGAGKSTLLKMITGVTFPTTGSVSVIGNVAALLELTAGFSSEMTGRENIYLKGYILGHNDDYMKQLEPDIIEFAELGDYIDQPVRTYSSGMRARLGFAINVNLKPDILVIDEALSVGDATFRKKCHKKINSIIATGVTVLFVSHSAESVRDICKRCIFLKKGKVVFDGETDAALRVYLESKGQVKKMGPNAVPIGKPLNKK